MPETIRIDVDDRGVATLKLSRPDKHNAMSGKMIGELAEAAERLGADPDVRCVVLAGEGQSFCAGGDLGWMQAQMRAEPAQRGAEARRLAEMLGALDRVPKPTIARVHGNAFGGGVGLIAVCDIAVGVEGALFGLTETKLGLIPATIGPYVAARMGTAARRVFFAPRLFGAGEALTLGLLSRRVTPEQLDECVEAEVRPCLDAAPGAMAAAKALLRTLTPSADPAMIEATIAALVERWESAEAREGVAAFFEKRKAAWMPRQ
jgi:methylglutaconyl-CoA hydratase